MDSRNQLIVLDTTLRDGIKGLDSPLSIADILEIARHLRDLKVDVIEAGFPAASPAEFEALQNISVEIKGITVAGLARATQEDIETTARALEKAESPRIHIFVPTTGPEASDDKRASLIQKSMTAVQIARRHFDDVEFSPHNATRADKNLLAELVRTAADAGAGTINISDTLGYALPGPFGKLVGWLRDCLPDPDKTVVSVHCHNDLGLAVANSLAALDAGARQVECTINGIGERAGNAALEEIVMGVITRDDVFDLDCRVDTTKIQSTSDLVSLRTGFPVPPNKAIVGKNALAYQTGIFQNGFSQGETYEIIKPEDIGAQRPSSGTSES